MIEIPNTNFLSGFEGIRGVFHVWTETCQSLDLQRSFTQGNSLGWCMMKLDDDKLENGVVRLEPLTEAHRSTLQESPAVKSMWDWMPVVPGGSGFDKYFDTTMKQKKSGEIVPFFINCQKTNEFAGVVAFLEPNKTHRRVRIGYVWHPEEKRGRGIFRATQLAMLDRAFAWGARRVQWIVDTRNTAALRATEALGAHQDGVMQEWQRLTDGSWSDVVIFSMLQSNWKKAREKIVSGVEELEAS